MFHEPIILEKCHWITLFFQKVLNNVDLVIFARFKFSRGGQTRKFINLPKIIIIIALPIIEIDNLPILDLTKSPKIINSRKFKHAKITRSTVYIIHYSSTDLKMKTLYLNL